MKDPGPEIRSSPAPQPGLLDGAKLRAARAPVRIVFSQPESDETLRAAVELARNGWAVPILLGDRSVLERRSVGLGLAIRELEIAGSAPRSAYRELWRFQFAPRGVGALESDASLADPALHARAMVRAGDAAAVILGPRAGVVPRGPWTPPPGALARIFVGPNSLIAEPVGRDAPPAARLAALALELACQAVRLGASLSHLVFQAPGVPVRLGSRSRYRSAGQELEERIREASLTVRARTASTLHEAIEVRESLTGMPGTSGVVLTQSMGGDRSRIGQMVGFPLVGPIYSGAGEVWGEIPGGSGAGEIALLAVVTGLSAVERGGGRGALNPGAGALEELLDAAPGFG